jgi:hypothetical protein
MDIGRFELNDLVDVFVGTGPNIRGTKTITIRGRFKGVRVVRGREFVLVRPLIGSQRGPCPAYPPESCIKCERSPIFFEAQTIFARDQHPYPSPPAPNAADVPSYPVLGRGDKTTHRRMTDNQKVGGR